MVNNDCQGFDIKSSCISSDIRCIFNSMKIMYRTVSLLLIVILEIVESIESGEFLFPSNKKRKKDVCFCHVDRLETDSSITSKTWFWPFVAVSIILLISVPCTFCTVAIYCRQRQQYLDDDDTSSVNSETSVSSIVVREHSRRPHISRSYHASGIRTPPPPYNSNEQPKTLFVTSSPPPSYCSERENLPAAN